MGAIRKLQYIGRQYLLNIPVQVVKGSQWQKGDYFELDRQGNGAFQIRKVAESSAEKSKVILAALEYEANHLTAKINIASANMSPPEFSMTLAQFSHVSAKIRKLRQRIKMQEAPAVV